MPIVPNASPVAFGLRSPANDKNHGGSGGSELGNWSSLIGIVTAIVGNVLIALALNVQRYAHIQLHRKRLEARQKAKEALKRVGGQRNGGYGAIETQITDGPGRDDEEEVDENAPDHPLAQSFQSSGTNWTECSGDGPKAASTYLKSPAWWLGQVLMTVGECGNFLAYGFAPASIVSPLGVVALISNCVIAPLFFGERFRKRDFWGVVIAVAGAITVVLSAKGEETKLDPHDVWDAITTMAFEIYMGVTAFLIIVLLWASPRYGHRTILIDLGLVGLFGGYTALTTKGVSSMLSSTFLKAFATPVTYGLVFVLVVTAVMQVRHVNKALQNFDSTQVIPIQFVLFTLSVIIGSAVLYRDFERTTAEQAAKFVGGCLLTFFGVFLITSGRNQSDDDDQLSDDENIEETISLRDQEGMGPYTDNNGNDVEGQSSTRAFSTSSSRRSSRVSFSRNLKPFRPGTLSSRKPGLPGPISPSFEPGGPLESSPLLNTVWRNTVGDHNPSLHPGIPPTISADSVPTIHSVTSVAVTEPAHQSSLSLPPPSSPERERPTTPRNLSGAASRPHSHHFSNAFISPSPLSSTVTAVVSDTLLRGTSEDTLGKRRRSIKRLGRPSIRSSLFVPHDDLETDGAGVSDPLLTGTGEGYQVPNADGEDTEETNGNGNTGSGSLRTRARSLSNTLGSFFGRRKSVSRRGSDPEGGDLGLPQPSPHTILVTEPSAVERNHDTTRGGENALEQRDSTVPGGAASEGGQLSK
ncbi:DUF803-domain-containing protein [Xylariaceae sp. FL0255]|nr:DUF803-domain-containing protein [Xylariaceae sp. FL0255]